MRAASERLVSLRNARIPCRALPLPEPLLLPFAGWPQTGKSLLLTRDSLVLHRRTRPRLCPAPSASSRTDVCARVRADHPLFLACVPDSPAPYSFRILPSAALSMTRQR